MSTSTRFDACLKFVLSWEGGYSNDPDDPGGATNLGIIQTEYNAYRLAHKEPQQTVKLITLTEATDIYNSNYWTPTHAAYLAQPLDVVLFDGAVNLGVGRTLEELQGVLGIPQTGVFDTATSTAYHAYADKHGVTQLADGVLARRTAYYRQIGTGKLSKFLAGWLNRVAALRTFAAL